MSAKELVASYLATRLCHDVTGPISAINQGIELLEDADEMMREEAMKLIVQSAEQASVRLQFYRLAYGHAPSQGTGALWDKKELIEAFFAPLRVQLNWDKMPSRQVSYGALRMLINLLMIAGESMIRGGDIMLVDTSEGDAFRFELFVAAKQLKLDESLLAALNGQAPVACDSAKTVQHHLALELLGLLGGHLQAEQLDECSWKLSYQS